MNLIYNDTYDKYANKMAHHTGKNYIKSSPSEQKELKILVFIAFFLHIKSNQSERFIMLVYIYTHYTRKYSNSATTLAARSHKTISDPDQN